MARQNVRLWDEDRTALLGQAELLVEKGKGGKNYFCAWLHDLEVDRCPFCGGDVIKVQDLFSRSYSELLVDGNLETAITLEYDFYKFRCLNNNCRHIFAKDISFASKYDNVTYRLTERIARLVIAGFSYKEVSDHFQNAITRQAVGQIFNRWVKEKEKSRYLRETPKCIAVMSGKTDNDYYTIVLNLDDGVRVLDILYGINSSDIVFLIKSLSPNGVQTIFSDFNPIITYAIKDNFPNANYMIPVDYWFKLVTGDFAEYAHEILRWSTVRGKDALILKSKAELGYRISDLERLLDSRPQIVPAYKKYNELRDIISRRDEMWIYEELTEWADALGPDFKEQLSATLLQLQLYQPELEAHVQYRELVPERLYSLTERLEELISSMRTFSDEVLKARVLYSTNTDLQNWRGVPIENAISALEKMTRNGEDYHEYE